ncbi:MAG: hypothetical protein ACK52J_04150 [bacterium]
MPFSDSILKNKLKIKNITIDYVFFSAPISCINIGCMKGFSYLSA